MKEPNNFEISNIKKGHTCNCTNTTHSKCETKREIKYKRFDKSLPELTKKENNAGYDLFSEIDIAIGAGDTCRIPLNIATEIPSGYVGLLFQRSSTFDTWGVRLTNNVGVIDSLYCGDSDEWLAEFRNETSDTAIIKKGDKICQAVFLQLADLVPVEVDKLGNKNRQGFGSSGRR
jgi:dUTP pyrophosphatase